MKDQHTLLILLLHLVLLYTVPVSSSLLMPREGTTFGKNIYERVAAETSFPEKEITVLLYVAARNDLAPFIERNLMQLMQVGTNHTITFLVYLCTAHHGKRKVTQRCIVYKNKLVQVGDDVPTDSGDPATLIAACEWAFSNFPSRQRYLFLWNHGTGCLEPQFRRAIHPSELYRYNPTTQRIELNRSLGFLEYLTQLDRTKGICFDNITKRYLTNHEVGVALRTVCDRCLGGRPIDVLCTDACLMQGTGFMYSLCAAGAAPVARYVVGSQEVVLATGYPYTHLFARIAEQPLTPYQFVHHVVQSFAMVYKELTDDYTQSAIDLFAIAPLYEQLERLAQLLLRGMQLEAQRSVRRWIGAASNKNNCTSFEEPSYKDLGHFLNNLLQELPKVRLTTPQATEEFKQTVRTTIELIKSLLPTIIVAHASGKNLAHASGLSIYIPGDVVHGSFAATDFGKQSSWPTLLHTLLQR